MLNPSTDYGEQKIGKTDGNDGSKGGNLAQQTKADASSNETIDSANGSNTENQKPIVAGGFKPYHEVHGGGNTISKRYTDVPDDFSSAWNGDVGAASAASGLVQGKAKGNSNLLVF
jgi:hypothetical protein